MRTVPKMPSHRRLPGLLLLILLPAVARAAVSDRLSLGGYVRETPLAWKAAAPMGGGEDRLFTNLLHARQNLRWYPVSSISGALEIKTRLVEGDAAGLFLLEADPSGATETYFDWEHTFIDRERTVLVSSLDRAWISGDAGPVQVRVGRQRIAWGTNLVWNPVDLFNPSSPLDFDNEEKPGNDAIRMQVYLGPNSSVEAAASPQRESDRTTAALKLTVNRWGYDWVVLAGRRRSDTVFGGAWAGNIHGGGFRGELLFARPRRETLSIDPYLTASVEGDYTFPGSLYLHAALLYNGAGTTGNAGGEQRIEAFVRGWYSPARASIFGEIARNLSPLVRADLSGILNPYDGSWYFGPMLTWSVAANLDLAVLGLFFGGDAGTEFGGSGEIAMLRLKYSF